jgi:hypothetical protein
MLAALEACGAGPHLPSAPAAATRLPGDIRDVVAIDEVGDATIVLARERAVVVRGGAVAASIAHGWRAGATIAALDGEGAWAVGVGDDGRLYRITLAGELEDITDRFGVAGVHAIAAAGTTTVFALPDGIAASTDGVHELRAQTTAPSVVAVSGSQIALGGPRGVEVWDLAGHQAHTYPIAATAVAFVGGRLAVATRDAVFVEHDGTLARLPITATQIAASNARLWILGDALYALEGTTLRRSTTTPPHGARLLASPNGDAFLASGTGIDRISLDARVSDPAWQAAVAPVFARVCAHCHLPGGDAGIDLSTAASWRADRDELVRRVIVTRTMPPAGTDLSQADRDALARWLKP